MGRGDGTAGPRGLMRGNETMRGEADAGQCRPSPVALTWVGTWGHSDGASCLPAARRSLLRAPGSGGPAPASLRGCCASRRGRPRLHVSKGDFVALRWWLSCGRSQTGVALTRVWTCGRVCCWGMNTLISQCRRDAGQFESRLCPSPSPAPRGGDSAARAQERGSSAQHTARPRAGAPALAAVCPLLASAPVCWAPAVHRPVCEAPKGPALAQ